MFGWEKDEALDMGEMGTYQLFKVHGLDITVSKSKLAAELAKPLAVKRGHAGFQEFALDGLRGVQP